MELAIFGQRRGELLAAAYCPRRPTGDRPLWRRARAGAAAFDATVLSARSRFFADALAVRYRARARREGIDGARGGAVTFVQRFGCSRNLHLHSHVAALDGVFARDANGALVFHEAPAPTRAELESVAGRVHRRAVAWLARHGHVDALAPAVR